MSSVTYSKTLEFTFSNAGVQEFNYYLDKSLRMTYGTYTWLDLIPMEPRPRLESRIPKVLAVRIQGVHRDGYTFIQDAGTIDISKRGAQLAWEICLKGPGEIIQVQHNQQKAHFRVVWVGQAGTPHANRIGICCLEADKCIWSAHLQLRPASG